VRVPLTLVLDFVPNAVHAGIYRAIVAGYYRDLNINLRIVQPTSTTDTLKLIDAGRAQVGLADGLDIAQLIDAGGDAQSIMAIVQRPLGGLIGLASSHLRTPKDLEGRDVGITGVPSDLAVLDTEVRHAGGDPARVHVVNIGFNGAAAVTAGRLAAFTGYWPDDGVQLQVSGHPTTTFKLDEWGGPSYPGLQAFTTRRLLTHAPALMRAFLAATVRGYEDTIADPSRSLNALLALNPNLPRGFTAASLQAYLPLFDAGGVKVGTLVPAHLAALTVWMRAHGLIHHAIAPSRFATNAYLPAG
jgi:NitT/TauT family transport system substrate-binding protein/putative hydroxymethylpyrimidine transport system substrate-binding protein